MARVLKQSKTINGTTSSSAWLWKQVIDEYFEEDSSKSDYYITSNKSYVVVKTYLGVASYTSSFGGTATTNITCNNVSRNKTQSWIYQSFWINPGEWKLIQEETFEIEHNDAGKKTILVNSSLSTTDFNPNSASASGQIELFAIPRSSDIAVPNTNLGQNIPITIGKKVDSYTSTLVYEIGSLSGTIVSKTSLSSYPWILSTDLITQIKNAYPNTKNVLAKIKCKTYSGNTQIGNETEATFYLYIVDKPTISNVVRTELNTNISSKTTAVLKSVSQNQFTITATAPVGTTIKGYRVKNGNQDSGLSTSNVVNLNDIQSSYKVGSSLKTKFLVKAIDNRDNESDEYEIVCDFIDYITVSINKTDTVIKRTNTTADDCIIYLTGNFYNSNIGASSNTITSKYRFKKQGTSSYSTWKTITTSSNGNKFTINNVKITDKFDYMYNYDFEFLISDSVSSSDYYVKTFVNSVPFVKYHKNGAWIKELTFDKAEIFPVGAIYISTTNTNPSKYFVGSWENFGKGRTLVGVDPDDEEFGISNKIGGEKTHVLVNEELPENALIDFGEFDSTFGWHTSETQTGYRANANSNGGIAHNNMQPYITVYFWKRIS